MRKIGDIVIQISGLTPMQVELADRLWRLDSADQVEAYIQMMPRKLRAEATVVRDMIIAAALDEYDGDMDLAKEVIDSVK